MTKAINILCTRPIDPALIETAGLKGIFIEVQSFIETVPVKTPAIQQEIENALRSPGIAVFTSMNAVDEVGTKLNGNKPHWKIYSVGSTTTQLVEKYFGVDLVASTANNASDLAALIVKDRLTDELFFFCGDQRRDELPDLLRKNDISISEIEVYHTIATPHKIDSDYDGILFFSPSAVTSFFSNNKVNQQTKFFAIGNTTAEAIKSFTSNEIIVSATPGKENLVNQMTAYFGEH